MGILNLSSQLVSQAPPPPQAARSKAKFESGKKQVSEDQQRQDTMNRMFATAKDVDQEDEDRKAKEMALDLEEQDVDEDEWVIIPGDAMDHIHIILKSSFVTLQDD